MKVIVDAGGLIAAERGDRNLAAVTPMDEDTDLIVPTLVLAQVWRGGRRQARLAHYLNGCEIVGVPADAGKRLGTLFGASDTCDVVDATVVDVARSHRASGIITSDPNDLRKLVRAAKLSVELLTV
jgi:hypothetical protein